MVPDMIKNRSLSRSALVGEYPREFLQPFKKTILLMICALVSLFTSCERPNLDKAFEITGSCKLQPPIHLSNGEQFRRIDGNATIKNLSSTDFEVQIISYSWRPVNAPKKAQGQILKRNLKGNEKWIIASNREISIPLGLSGEKVSQLIRDAGQSGVALLLAIHSTRGQLIYFKAEVPKFDYLEPTSLNFRQTDESSLVIP